MFEIFYVENFVWINRVFIISLNKSFYNVNCFDESNISKKY